MILKNDIPKKGPTVCQYMHWFSMLHQNINDNLSWRLIPGDNHDVSPFPHRPIPFLVCMLKFPRRVSLSTDDLFSHDDCKIICLIQPRQIRSYSNDRLVENFEPAGNLVGCAVKPSRPSRVLRISSMHNSNPWLTFTFLTNCGTHGMRNNRGNRMFWDMREW